MSQYINQLFTSALREFQQNNLQRSKDLIETILKVQPKNFEANHLIGVICGVQNDHAQAKKYFEKALKANNKDVWTYFNLAKSLTELGEVSEALHQYSKAIQLKPNFAEALTNKSNILCKLKRLDEALTHSEKAIQLMPNLAEAWSSRAFILYGMKLYDEAIASSEKSIELKPDLAEPYYNLGNIFHFQKEFELAIRNYEKTYNLDPEYDYLLGYILNIKMMMCDWSDFEHTRKLLLQKLTNKQKTSDPFCNLAIADSPAAHRDCSEIYIQDRAPSNNSLGAIPKKLLNNKILLGYFSADFHNHAVSFLIAELFELHNQEQFELIAFTFGPEVKDEMHNRLSKSFNQFIDIRNKSDQEVAILSRKLGVDIAIDLVGLTRDSRTGIFSFRAAPIQVNYLGYPGTMGANYIDYIIADNNLIPAKSKEFYSEKIIYLPNTYQVNDRKKIISDMKFSRAELGLPEDSFVFCCFNNNYKILPETFDGWMRILIAVEGSVLWLFQDNDWVVNNLKEEAQKRGISEGRLVFAKKLPLPEHLARHRQVDLFLDTFPYNAHTTASDALWAGLPVLTLMGESFASRVAASLLTAIGLPELITSSREHYEALAIELATNPTKLKVIKAKLESNRLTTPLFDTPRFTKHLEDAYTKMYERYHADLPPEHIYIEDKLTSY
jgi:protein O-GlcNAc transferase